MLSESTSPYQRQVPGTVHDAFVPQPISGAPFGPTAPLLPHDFVDQLLARRTPATHIYDAKLGYALAVISAWTYADGQTLSNKLKYYGLPFNTVHQIAVLNPAMLVVATAHLVRSKCGRVAILTFRGTEPVNAINWLTDADCSAVPFTYGNVHSGFQSNVEAVWDEISTELEHATEGTPSAVAPPDESEERRARDQSKEPLQALYITGHSLGAAMAVLAAAKIMMTSNERLANAVRGIYTFGQPAVGDAEFANECDKLFGSMMFRHVYRHDVVPHMPPRSFGQFSHFGEGRFSSATGEPWCSDGHRLTKQSIMFLATAMVAVTEFVTRRMPLLRSLDLPYSIADHSPARYIEVSRTTLVHH